MQRKCVISARNRQKHHSYLRDTTLGSEEELDLDAGREVGLDAGREVGLDAEEELGLVS
jgi:hypothetical protein